MTQLILTRFLYSKDEVELSLLTSLLKNDDLQIIYYWAYELYYSGFDIFAFMWKIYLDFYYIQNPYLETYFIKKYNLWKKDGDMKHVAYILRNMYNLPIDSSVFLSRQSYNCVEASTSIYRFKDGVVPAWLMGIDKKYHNLLVAIKKRNFENIWFYLDKVYDADANANDDDANANDANAYICKVIGDLLNVNISINIVGSTLHYLIAVIIKSLLHPSKSLLHMPLALPLAKHLFVVPKQEHLDEIIKLEKEVIGKTYDTLMFKRMVEVHDMIGSFDLERWNWSTHDEFINANWFHWEYYAMGSPLWLARLNDAGGKVNDITKTIVFDTDEQQEDFYNLYAYDLDELPKEVQNMSMKPLSKNDGSVWYKFIFSEDYPGKDLYNEIWYY